MRLPSGDVVHMRGNRPHRRNGDQGERWRPQYHGHDPVRSDDQCEDTRARQHGGRGCEDTQSECDEETDGESVVRTPDYVAQSSNRNFG